MASFPTVVSVGKKAAILRIYVDGAPDLTGVNNARGRKPHLKLHDPGAATDLANVLAAQYLANIAERASKGFRASGVWFNKIHCKDGCPVTFSIKNSSFKTDLHEAGNTLLSEILAIRNPSATKPIIDISDWTRYDTGARFIIVDEDLSQFDFAHATNDATRGLSIGYNTAIQDVTITVIIYIQTGLFVKPPVEDKVKEVDSDAVAYFRVKWFGDGLFQNQGTHSNDSKEFALFVLQQICLLEGNQEGTFKGTTADKNSKYIASYVKVETNNLDMAVEMAIKRFDGVWETDPEVSMSIGLKSQYENLKQKTGLSQLDFYFLLTSDKVDTAIVAIGSIALVVFRTTQPVDFILQPNKAVFGLLAKINSFRATHNAPTIMLDVDTSHEELAILLDQNSVKPNQVYGRENGFQPASFFFRKIPHLQEQSIDKIKEFLASVLNKNTNPKTDTHSLRFLSRDVAIRETNDLGHLQEEILFAKKVGFFIRNSSDGAHLLIILRFSPVPLVDEYFEWGYKLAIKLRGSPVNREKSLRLSLVADTQAKDSLKSVNESGVTHIVTGNQYATTTFIFRDIIKESFDEASTEAISQAMTALEDLATNKNTDLGNNPIINTYVEQDSSKFILVQKSNKITPVSLAQMRCRESDGIGFAYELTKSKNSASFNVAISWAWEHPISTPELIIDLFYSKRLKFHKVPKPKTIEIPNPIAKNVANLLLSRLQTNDTATDIPGRGFGITRDFQFSFVFVTTDSLTDLGEHDSKMLPAASLAMDAVLSVKQNYAIPNTMNGSMEEISEDLLLMQDNIDYAYVQLCIENEKPVDIGVAEGTGGVMIVFQTKRENINFAVNSAKGEIQTLYKSGWNFHADKLARALLHGFGIEQMSGGLEGKDSGFRASFTVEPSSNTPDQEKLITNLLKTISATKKKDEFLNSNKTKMLHGTFKNVWENISRQDKDNLESADGLGYGSRCDGTKCASTILYYNRSYDNYLKKLGMFVKNKAKIAGITGAIQVAPGTIPNSKEVFSTLLRQSIPIIPASGLGLFEVEGSKFAVVYNQLTTKEIGKRDPTDVSINAILDGMKICNNKQDYKSIETMVPLKTLEMSNIKFTPITASRSLADFVLFCQSSLVTANFFVSVNKDGVLAGIVKEVFEFEIEMLPSSVLNFARQVKGKSKVQLEEGFENSAKGILNSLGQTDIGNSKSLFNIIDKRTHAYTLIHRRRCETGQGLAVRLALTLECINTLIDKKQHLDLENIQINFDYTAETKLYTVILVCREYTWTRQLQQILKDNYSATTKLTPTSLGTSNVTATIESYMASIKSDMDSGLYLLRSQNIGISIINLKKYTGGASVEKILIDFTTTMHSNAPIDMKNLESNFVQSKQEFVKLSSGASILDLIQLTHKPPVKVGISFFLDKNGIPRHLGIVYFEHTTAKLLQTLIPNILKPITQLGSGKEYMREENTKAAFNPILSELLPMDKFPKACERGVLFQENISRLFEIRSLKSTNPAQIFVDFVNSICRICNPQGPIDSSFPYVTQSSSDKNKYLVVVDVDDKAIQDMMNRVGPIQIDVVQDKERVAVFISYVPTSHNKESGDRAALRKHLAEIVKKNIDETVQSYMDLAASLVAKVVTKLTPAKSSEIYLTNGSNLNMQKNSARRQNVRQPSSQQLRTNTGTSRQENARIVIMENVAAIIVKSKSNSANDAEIAETLRTLTSTIIANRKSRFLKKDCGFMLVQDFISVEEITHMMGEVAIGVAIEAKSVVYLFRIQNSYTLAVASIADSKAEARNNSASLSTLAAQLVSVLAPITESTPNVFRTGSIRAESLTTDIKMFYFTEIWSSEGIHQKSIEQSMETLLKTFDASTNDGTQAASPSAANYNINGLCTVAFDNVAKSSSLREEISKARFVGFFGEDVPVTTKRKDEKWDYKRILIGVYVPAFRSGSGRTLDYTASHTTLPGAKGKSEIQKSNRNLRNFQNSQKF